MTKQVAGLGIGLLAIVSVTATELTIATYNVENYVTTNRLIPTGYRRDYPKPEAAKRALRAVIRQLNADVLVLQEMGPVEYLTELQRDLLSQGTPYSHAVLMQGADEDRHVAVLSRLPLPTIKQHPGLVFKYQDGMETVKRGLLEVGLETPMGPLTLWALHLKSRYTDEKEDPGSERRRAGEAMAIREFILKQTDDPEGALFMILGDFNDDKASAPVRYLTRRGKLNFARLVPASDGNGEHWTYHYRKEDSYSRVDHILVSTALWPMVANGEARIADGAEVRRASDHRPVIVRLEFDAPTVQAKDTTNQAIEASNATARD